MSLRPAARPATANVDNVESRLDRVLKIGFDHAIEVHGQKDAEVGATLKNDSTIKQLFISMGLKIDPNRSLSGGLPEALDAPKSFVTISSRGATFFIPRIKGSQGFYGTDHFMVGFINPSVVKYSVRNEYAQFLENRDAPNPPNVRYSRPLPDKKADKESDYVKTFRKYIAEHVARARQFQAGDFSQFSKDAVEFQPFHNVWLFLTLPKKDHYMAFGRFKIVGFEEPNLILQPVSLIPNPEGIRRIKERKLVVPEAPSATVPTDDDIQAASNLLRMGN